MNPALVRWLLHAYPRAWRDRYGEELEVLLQASPGGLRATLNVLRAALHERWLPTTKEGLGMAAGPGSILVLAREPSAFLPMVMSIGALSAVVLSLSIFGIPPPHTDEGATAHIWQLLMALQVPLIVWFALRWLPKAPRLAMGVLGIQAILMLAAMAPVYILRL